MQKETPASTVTRLKCSAEYPTIKAVPYDEKSKMGIKHTMKLFQSVALPKSLVPQVFLQKEKG